MSSKLIPLDGDRSVTGFSADARACCRMVLRSSSTAQTGQVSGLAQSVGYCLAATGPPDDADRALVAAEWAFSAK